MIDRLNLKVEFVNRGFLVLGAARVRVLYVLAGLFGLGLAGCGGGGPSVPEPIAFIDDGTVLVTGGFTKGPVAAASIAAFPIDAAGFKAGPNAVATAVSDNNGRFTLQVPQNSGDLLIETAGGEYVDEADQEPDPTLKRRIILGPNEGLQAILPAGATQVAVTIPAQALLERARREAGGNNFAAIYAAILSQATQAYGFDVTATLPQNPTSPDANASLAERQYAMLLGGVANVLNRAAITAGAPVPDASTIQGVVADLSDGRIDGLLLGNPVLVTVDQAQVPLATILLLNDEIARFKNNNFSAYSATATIIVNENALSQPVTPENSPPVAIADDYAVDFIGGTLIGDPGVLANDSDPQNDALTSAVDTPPSNGQLTLNTDGTFTYIHDGSITLSDSFGYIASDGNGGETTAIVNLAINQVNEDGTIPYTTAEVPPVIYTVFEKQGFFSGFPFTATLNPDNTGIFEGRGSEGEAGIVWSIDAVGRLVIDFPQPLSQGTFFANASCPEGSPAMQYEKETFLERIVIVRNEDGPAEDRVNVLTQRRETWRPPCNFLPDEVFVASPVASNEQLLFGPDSVQPFTVGQLTATANAFHYYHTDNNGNPNSPPEFVMDVLDFNADGSGLTRRRQFAFTWAIDGDGSLTLSFPNGDSNRYVRLVELEDGIASGIMFGDLVGVPTNVNSFLAITVNEPIAFENAVVADKRYRGAVAINDDDREIFDFVFFPDLSACRNPNGDYVWSLVNGRIELVRDQISFVRYRTWQPLRLVGNRYYVIETLQFYDPTTEMPIDPGVTPGRINFYEVRQDLNGNLRPEPQNDLLAASVDTPLSITLDVLLANDSDPENDELRVTSVDGVSANGGVITTRTDSSGSPVGLTYTPAVGFTGTDSFTYSMTDLYCTFDPSFTATVQVEVSQGGAVNNPPVARNDAYAFNENQILSVSVPGVLGNDTDADNDVLSAAVVTPPVNGQLSLNGDGSFTYTHDGSENLTDSFTYTVSDGNGGTATGTVSLGITLVNDPPVAITDNYAVDQGETLIIAAPGVLDNDSDDEGDPLSVAPANVPTTNGQVNIAADGSFTYTHDGSGTLTDSFTYAVSDGIGGTTFGVVNININIPLSAAGVTFAIDEVGGGVLIQGSGSYDLTGATLLFSATQSGFINPSAGLAVGGPSFDANVQAYSMSLNAGAFGTGGFQFGSMDMGDVFGLDSITGFITVPTGYASGQPLSGSTLIPGQSFASLGLTEGGFQYAIPNDTLAVIIGGNANLDDLTLTNVTLDTPFSPDQFVYAATVPFLTSSTQVSPTAEAAGATIVVNGVAVISGQTSDPIDLLEGSNTISINVTAQDGVTVNTYTIDVTRQSAPGFAEQAYIKASNAEAGDSFGYRLAISADGNTLAVSTISEDSSAAGVNANQLDNGAPDSGAVYVFGRDAGGNWTQQAYLKASNNNTLATAETGGSLDGLFGYRLAISTDGNTLAVASVYESSSATGINGDQLNGDERGSGAAYIFRRDGMGVWTQQAYIKASNTAQNDRFAASIALSGDGNTLAAGARGEDSAATGINGDESDNSAASSGAAYVFTFDGAAWSQQAYIKASNAEAGDQFGMSVSLSGAGNTLVVAASAEDSAAVGVNGDQLDNSAATSGAAYVFTRDGGGNWSQQAYLKASNTEDGDRLGGFGITALSADGNTLAVGAVFEDSSATGVDGNQGDNSAVDSGAVYVFARNGVLWAQQAYVKASNTDAGDRFGQQLSLSPDGARLLVGADQESSAAQGIDATQADNSAEAAGAAYLFTRDGSNVWSQQAYIKASNAEGGDQFGLGVALADTAMAISGISEDGGFAGIGGDQNDNSAEGSGAVYVFDVPQVADPADADLGALTLSGVMLDQPFDMDLFNYTATVPFTTGSTEITPTSVNGNATIMVNGVTVPSGQGTTVVLAEGTNIITITVTSEDDSASQTYTINVTREGAAVFAQEAYIKASNTDAGDSFGQTISVSGDGNTLAVGTFSEQSAATGINGDENDNTFTQAGAVYVFMRDGAGVWVQQAYVKASNTDDLDTFGVPVALSGDGNTLAVGARAEDSAATGINGDQNDNSFSQSGAVYVYTRDGVGVWTQQAYIKASNTDANDQYGVAVTLSGDGNTLAVGADQEQSAATGVNGDQSDNSAGASGAVYMYTRDGAGVWTQQAYLKASNTEPGDRFGTSIDVSVDGNTLAVNARGEASAATGIDGDQNDNSAAFAGAVYIFTRDGGGVWSQQAYVKASNTDELDQFGGNGVALSGDGDTLVVAAKDEDSAATGVNGDQTDNSASTAGAVYVYTRSGIVWTQQAYIKASNTDVQDQFGATAGLSGDGNTLAVGALGERSSATGIDGDQSDNSAFNAGAVYVFIRDGTGVWTQQIYVKASNTDASDGFGNVTVSGDGNTLAVTAFGEDSAATGINGDQGDNSALTSGAAYVFDVPL